MINEHNNSKQKQTLLPNNTKIPPTQSYRKNSCLNTIPQTKTNLRPVAGMCPHNVTHTNPQHGSGSPSYRPPAYKGRGEVALGAVINIGKTYKGRVSIETPAQPSAHPAEYSQSYSVPKLSTAVRTEHCPLSSRWMYLDHHF